MLFSILKNETDDSSIEKQILIVNAGTKSVTEATGIKSTSTMGKKVSSLFKPVDESLDIDRVILKSWSKRKDSHLFVDNDY